MSKQTTAASLLIAFGYLFATPLAAQNPLSAPGSPQPKAAPVAPASAPKVQSAIRLTASDLESFSKQLRDCWHPGPGFPALRARIKLKRNGMIEGTPEIIGGEDNAITKTARAEILRTLKACQPYKLPAAYYDNWKELDLGFKPWDGATGETPPANAPASPPLSPPPSQSSKLLAEQDIRNFGTQLGDCLKKAGLKADAVKVRIVLDLNRDGTLKETPKVIISGKSEELSESMQQALTACQPYKLPQASYESWKQLDIGFTPADLLTGSKPASNAPAAPLPPAPPMPPVPQP